MRKNDMIPASPVRRPNAGYSLTEVLVAVVIFAALVIAALMIYDRSNREFKAGVEATNMQQNTRVAFTKLEGDMRMAGYDFDRDGIPVGSVGTSNAYQQPDEQFEYIGPAAITIRGNFDYETENSPCTVSLTTNCDNGREKDLETTQFPLVTTANDELVTYALVPDSQGAWSAGTCVPASTCVQFYADVRNPRRAYPDATNGGLDETLVQIPNVDLCIGGCTHPPYTLYRFALRRDQSTFTNGANIDATPLASNIRSLNFTYFQDAFGRDTLKDIANTTDVSTGESVAGGGQWTVANPLAQISERIIRAKVNSVQVTLVGLNEAEDPNYTDPTETVAAVSHYRKYSLQSLTNPRNIQKRGMREQDTQPPGAPIINAIYTGRCGIFYIVWTAPTVSATRGAPDQYKIIYGPRVSSGSQTYPYETTTFTNTFGYVTGLTPDVEYAVEVVALNSYGSMASVPAYATPKNTTTPAAPANVVASTTFANRVHLTWNRPTTNAAGTAGGGPVVMIASEIYGYRVERTADTTGASGWSTVAEYTTLHSTADVVEYDDTTVTNCVPYIYRVTAVELCYNDNNYNIPANKNLAISAASSFSNQGIGASSVPPSAPGDLIVDQASTCTAGLCNVAMSWQKVTTDTSGNAVTIGQYNVYRRLKGSASWTQVGSQTTIPATSTVTYTDPNVDISSGQQYEYMFRAVQCGMESGDSPTRPYPCTFPTGVVGSPVMSSNGFDGSGTSASPWLVAVDPVLSVNVTNAAGIQRIVARVYTGTTLVNTYTVTAAPYSFTWTMPDNGTQRVDLSIVETGGCVASYSAYFTDMPQSCCLRPKSSDATIVSYTTGQTYVDVYLKNACSEVLTLTSLSMTFNSALTPGGTKWDHVEFPAASGGSAVVTYTFPSGTNSTSVTLTPPYGGTTATQTATVPGSSSTYKVRVYFSKALTNPTQPVTAFTPSYTRPADLSAAACPIIP